MTSVDRFEATIAEWLDAESAYHLPDHLGEVVAQTAVTRQRPAWSSLERWLPMQSTLRVRARAQARAGIALLALAILAVVGIAMLATGSRRVQLAPPTGLARNGPMAYDKARRHLPLRPGDGGRDRPDHQHAKRHGAAVLA